jgi:hypothetical protein
MSAQAKKDLAARHMREQLEAKQQRDAEPKAWQQIAHRDHPAPAPTPAPAPVGEDQKGPPVALGTGDRGGDS